MDAESVRWRVLTAITARYIFEDILPAEMVAVPSEYETSGDREYFESLAGDGDYAPAVAEFESSGDREFYEAQDGR